MRKQLSSIAIVLSLILAGCKAPPLQVVPGAIIRNVATLDYAYGGGTTFAVKSVPVDVITLVPRASADASLASAASAAREAAATSGNSSAKSQSDSTQASAASAAREAAATSGNSSAKSQSDSTQASAVSAAREAAATSGSSSTKSQSNSMQAHAETSQTEVGASRKDSQAASSNAVTAAGGHSASVTASGSQASSSSGSSASQQSAAASEKTESRSSSVSAKDSAASGTEKSYSSDIKNKTAQAHLESNDAQAKAAWSSKQPAIRKWATRKRAVVGDKYEYIIEVRNGTPLDLAFVEVSDQLDPQLSVKPSDVRTEPRMKIEATLTDGRLSVRFPNGIGRGHAVKIHLPTVIRTNTARP
jgi:uncharacterized repeat protein (TIGR01451 family)